MSNFESHNFCSQAFLCFPEGRLLSESSTITDIHAITETKAREENNVNRTLKKVAGLEQRHEDPQVTNETRTCTGLCQDGYLRSTHES